MKKIATLLLTVILIFACVACGNQSESKGKATIVILGETSQVYTVDLEKVEITEGAFSLLKYLKDNENLVLEYSESATGAFITKIGTLNPTQSNQFIAVYTTVEADDESTYGSCEYEGKTIYSSGVGVSSMTIVDGAIICFNISTF